MTMRKTATAARELGISYSRLHGLLRAEKMAAPQKDTSGDYVWTDEDLEAARRAMVLDYRRKVEGRTNSSQVQIGVVK